MITIVDYEAGNLTSVQRALCSLGIDSCICPDPDKLRSADRIIFPGVGEAGSAMKILQSRGLDQALSDAFSREIPILGICLGSQIILSHSEESDTSCLGLIAGTCPRFNVGPSTELKIPHMGWDAITITRPHPLLAGIHAGDEFYFVHSYYPRPDNQSQVFAVCDYGTVFPAAIGLRNLFAVQFHPEKSGRIGLRILKNFSEWTGIAEETC